MKAKEIKETIDRIIELYGEDSEVVFSLAKGTTKYGFELEQLRFGEVVSNDETKSVAVLFE